MDLLDPQQGSPPEDAPPAPSPDQPALELPWTDADAQAWRARLSVARDSLTPVIEDGKKNIERYVNRYLKAGELTQDRVSIPAPFWYTENKKAQLFYRVPEVQLTGKRPASDAVAPLAQQVLNEYLGPEHANVRLPMAELIFDTICPVGFGVCKVGYESFTVPVEAPPDPLQPDAPARTVMVPVHEAYYMRRISPGKLLRPNEFHGFDYDLASWIGFAFEEDVPPGTAGASATTPDDERLLSTPQTPIGTGRAVRRGVEIWYRRSAFDPSVKDPNEYAVFVLMDGEPTPREHRRSPLHRRGQDGKWIGMTGFPVKVLKVRYVSDSADAPSDVAITRNLSDEQSRGRTQLLLSRDRKMPTVVYDNTRPGIKDLIDKIARNESHGFVGVPGDPRDLFHVLDKGSTAQESYAFNDYVEHDQEKAWSMGSNQQGVNTDSARTATELSLVQEAADTRLAYERDHVAYFFTDKIARNLLGLLQLFATAQNFVRIVGPDGAVGFKAWNADAIQGEFGFSIKLNSQLRPDAASDMKRVSDFVNFGSRSPFLDQLQLWRAAAQAWGFDPNQIVKKPEPPKKEPPNVSLSLALSPIDFANPVTAPYALAMAKAAGLEMPALPPVDPAAAPPGPNPLTPGTNPEADVLSKHKQLQTGNLDGAGAATGAPRVQ